MPGVRVADDRCNPCLRSTLQLRSLLLTAVPTYDKDRHVPDLFRDRTRDGCRPYFMLASFDDAAGTVGKLTGDGEIEGMLSPLLDPESGTPTSAANAAGRNTAGGGAPAGEAGAGAAGAGLRRFASRDEGFNSTGKVVYSSMVGGVHALKAADGPCAFDVGIGVRAGVTLELRFFHVPTGGAGRQLFCARVHTLGLAPPPRAPEGLAPRPPPARTKNCLCPRFQVRRRKCLGFVLLTIGNSCVV